MNVVCRYWPREGEDWASTRRIAGLDEVRLRCAHLQHRIPPCQDIRDGVFDAIIAEAAAARKEGRMVCAEYNHGARFRFLLSLCVQVVLLAESQGGQVASRLAPLMMPDLLVLLVSLPDDLDIAPLRNANIQTVIGWKVVRLFFRFLPLT